MALFEYRVYEAVPGKLPALNRRFQTITLGYFQKYGIGGVGFWEAIVGTTNELHSILREQGNATPRVALERAGNVGMIDAWQTSRLRCPRCGGSVYVDQVEIVERRIEPVEWEDDGPRRGRPPKWLVEQRRRKQQRELSA